jgi:hypothetical protein
MPKGLFEILTEMNKLDVNNGTKLARVSNSFVSGNKVKQGSTITMGTEEQCLHDLMSGKAMALLVVVDKQEYERLYHATPQH